MVLTKEPSGAEENQLKLIFDISKGNAGEQR